MGDIFLFIALMLAVAAGWGLGRFQNRVRFRKILPSLNRDHNREHSNREHSNREYYSGLDFLINDQPDEAIESFIRVLEVNSDTIPAHLALAKLFRRKGDFERAIQIHQDLLNRPNLSSSDLQRIQMALARDYDAIGLLDRAEQILLEIVQSKPEAEIRTKALMLLMRLYEKEGEWRKALETAARLEHDQMHSVQHKLAHYYCELAEIFHFQQNDEKASGYLQKALQRDRNCVRATLLQAHVHMRAGAWRSAIKVLKRVPDQNLLLVSETIPLLERCYREQGAMHEFEQYLNLCLHKAPSTTVILAMAERVDAREGINAAAMFIMEELKKRPSIRGFNRLIDLHIQQGGHSVKESLTTLRGLTGQLERSKPVYQCLQCGFEGRTLHWHCPSCREWDSTRPVQGLEGE
ncbi:lipopolysaccharide assembly protein LapB [Nitrincola alkalilacustris]|uniref:lipopolysaccharide assembly protein LapB n=1 Tax=Nitrincola alkalilacustris TaxID=1571224 RepID=UPI00124CE7F6|nr:lipopolysaccharide assembly protein LapB [Nitrincola alkalilacustris]